ncbi:MAG: kelch repeat-containing protein [Bacteroidota bacterium]|nr:kelch repeat-containing protein [Bacteroidota bacterium]
MKRINTALLLLLSLGVLFSCSKASLDYTQNGNWVSRAIFKGVPMAYGASFVVDNIAYVGTGYNPTTPNTRLASMFKYTPSPINTSAPTGYDSAYGGWSQVADFAGGGRSNAVGFSIGALGYLGSGTPDGFTPLSDFYSYNPTANQWTKIDNMGTGGQVFPRVDAVSFSFDTTGYVLTGTDYNYYFGDVWKYSPATGHWSQETDMPGSKRSQAATWMYKGNGYLLTGFTPGSQWTAGGNACYDFWKFNPATHIWTRLRDIYNTNASQTYDDGYTNIVRYHAAAFTILGTASGDKGYITTGANGVPYNYTWEYDFATDLWTQKTPYEGSARQGAVGFTVLNRGFVTTGISGSTANDDTREFFPNQIYNQYD